MKTGKEVFKFLLRLVLVIITFTLCYLPGVLAAMGIQKLTGLYPESICIAMSGMITAYFFWNFREFATWLFNISLFKPLGDLVEYYLPKGTPFIMELGVEIIVAIPFFLFSYNKIFGFIDNLHAKKKVTFKTKVATYNS